MNRSLLLIFTVIFLSCNHQPTDKSKEAIDEIIKADLAMSDLAAKEGFFQALLQYAEDSVIIPRDGKLPMIGRNEVAENWKSKPLFKDVSWHPIRAEASQSGDIGYSFGYARFGGDSVTYSNYCTIWKKQKDGKWKFVYDGGNDIPKP